MDIERIKDNKTTEELLEFGIINIDKSSGPTSFNVSDFVRKKFREVERKHPLVRKTSHFGTLDPKVTGVLPVALNRACKLTGFFIGRNKEYIGIMRIHKDISLGEIRNMIRKKFLGKILQTPPRKSRVKRQEREREVKRFDLLEKDGNDVLFHAEVQGGTYIRKLISDLGDELGIGAHMLELRRIRAGIFEEYDKNYPSVNLYDFEKAVREFENGNERDLRRILIPGEIISEICPVIKIKKDNLESIFTGKSIFKKDLIEDYNFEIGKIVCVFCEEIFVGIYEIIEDENKFAKPKFVLQPVRK